MTEPSRVRPPADFWREVPCGHPPDPVAWNSPNGPVCHCGTDLDLEPARSAPPEAPQQPEARVDLEAMSREFHALVSAVVAGDERNIDRHLDALGNLGLNDPRPFLRTSTEGESARVEISLTRADALLIREGMFAEPGGPAPIEAMDTLLAALNAVLEPAPPSTEGGAWEGCVERDGIVVEPAQSEGAGEARKIIGICRNPGEPFYWDADRIGEPCPNACESFYDESEPVPYPHEFYVLVYPAPPSPTEQEE